MIGQKQLEAFREEMSSKVNDAYTVLLREKKLPLQLLDDPDRRVGAKAARSSLLTVQPFSETFSAGRRRKRPKLAAEGLEQLVAHAEGVNARWVGVASRDARGGRTCHGWADPTRPGGWGHLEHAATVALAAASPPPPLLAPRRSCASFRSLAALTARRAPRATCGTR